MPGKRPAEQWYTGDWYRAVDVQKCCPATRGIWRDAIDAMTNEQITGKIRANRQELCRLLRCSPEELQRFFDDNKAHRFADVTERNKIVTIINRRLYRAYIEREQTKKRVRRHRQVGKRKSNGDVTPYSSTSTSSSNNNGTGNVTNTVTGNGEVLLFAKQDFLDAGLVAGLSENEASACYDHYAGQQFEFASGHRIRSAADACKRWRNNRHRFAGKEQQEPLDDQVKKLEAEGLL